MARSGNLTVKVRPIKLAFLIDPNSEIQLQQAIQLSSTIWGGAYCPIISLYKRLPHSWKRGPLKCPKAIDVILGYIEAFDPDILVQFSEQIPPLVQNIGLRIIKPNEIWDVLDEENTLAPKFGIGLFEIFNELFDTYYKYKRKYPVRIAIPELPKKHRIFWGGLLGDLPSKLVPLVKQHYSDHLEIDHSKLEPDEAARLLKPEILFLRRITQHFLNHRSRSGPFNHAYAFFLDWDKVEDIIDYWNLRATGRHVLAIPKQLQANENWKNLVIQFLKANRIPWRHNKTSCDMASIVPSRNSTMDEVQKFASTLIIPQIPDDTSDDPFFVLQHWYPRIWDEWARDKDGANPNDLFGDEETTDITEGTGLKIAYRPLFPKFADKHAYYGEPRCANEIGFSLYGSTEYLAEAFPKSSGKHFIQTISGLFSFGDYWRVGRNGLVKFVKDYFVDTWDIPSSQDVIFAWLKDLNWECAQSSSGLVAKQIYKQLDGHPAILTNEKLLGVLEHMNGGMVQLNGQPVNKNRINQERELPIGEIKSRLHDLSGSSNLTDYLISKGVFQVGLRVQCPFCFRNSWYSVEQIDKDFTCPRCLTTFSAIGNIEKGGWCYKTVGPFSIPHYADGAYATLLSLEFFSDMRLVTFKSTPALNFTAVGPDKKNIEADFALLWQEAIRGEEQSGLLFGECKSYNKFEEKDFQRMRYLTKKFPGAVIVFSTLRKELTPKEIKGMARIAKMGRKYWKTGKPINPVLILTGNEILSLRNPPYCWENLVAKDRFQHIAGLLNICNATQQIYLNLPSWEKEWRDKWDKSREKALLKAKSIQKEVP
jgi:hypothetical protein